MLPLILIAIAISVGARDAPIGLGLNVKLVGCRAACAVTNVTTVDVGVLPPSIWIDTDATVDSSGTPIHTCFMSILYFRERSFKYEQPQPHFWCGLPCTFAFDCGNLVVTIAVSETETTYPYHIISHGRITYQLGDATATYEEY